MHLKGEIRMSVTIKDVAKAANVAPSTVSRVIADSPRISEKTKRKVRQVMKELGYHPNFIARSLASQSTNVIGIVFPGSGNLAFQNPFYSEVLRGISEGVHHKHYGIQLTTGTTEDEIYEDVVRMVQGRRVDGVIMLYSKINDKIIHYLRDKKFPFVVIGKPYEDAEQITHIDNDNITAAKEATKHLLNLGHTRIGFIGGSKDLMVTVTRLEGYKRALQEYNIPIREDYIIHEEFLISGGKQGVLEIMSTSEPPTALVVADDLMAMGVLRTLHLMGYEIPGSVSVVSFNNALFSELSTPPLTTVDINILELGIQSVKHLLAIIENPEEPIKRVIVPHKLIIRSSCAKLR